ncbi:hypothetical protein BRD18_04140 [Halobacteriales archaeon SW_7_71_33]|nr:MAG: hypothetical protein BRD18_04140 [Halobacteriales archaeon SW_7_71_33]
MMLSILLGRPTKPSALSTRSDDASTAGGSTAIDEERSESERVETRLALRFHQAPPGYSRTSPPGRDSFGRLAIARRRRRTK